MYFLYCYRSENVLFCSSFCSLPGYALYVLIFPQYFRDFASLFPVRCLISLKAFSILFLSLPLLQNVSISLVFVPPTPRSYWLAL